MDFEDNNNIKNGEGSVKKMAVMTSKSDHTNFVIDSKKVVAFCRNRCEVSSKMNYELVAKQAEKIRERIVKGKQNNGR